MYRHLGYLLKSLAISFFLLLYFSPNALAAQAQVAWNADASQVAGYKVYYGLSSGNYSNSSDAGSNTAYTLQNLSASTYYVAVTAYDSAGDQSAYSPELVVDSLTASAGTGGTISPRGTFFQSQGSSQTFTITPSAGYQVASVLVDGVSVGAVTSYTLSNITANHTISATFAASPTTYTVTASAGSNGSISPSGSVSVSSGSTKQFTVTPSSGYTAFVGGTCGGTLSANTYTTNPITANCTVTASFTINSYTVTPSAGSNGTMSPSTAQSVNYNGTTSFTVTPNTGYKISSVTGCGGTLSGSTYTTGPITGNCAVSASFAANSYTVTPSAGSNGTINPSTAQSVNYNGTTSFTVTPNTGYSVSSVTGCGGTLSGSTYTTGAITGNCAVSASFTANSYTVTPSAGSNGTMSPSAAQSVNYNGTTSFTVTPNTGYKISSVTGCGGTLSGSTYTTGPITGNCTVAASFVDPKYTISASAGSNGSISPSGSVTAASGSTQQFSVAPNSGYKASVGGTCGGTLSGNTYTTNPITANCTVSASFTANSYTVTPSAGSNGTMSPSTAQSVNYNGTTSFTVTPNTGYKISSVTGCGGTLSGSTYTTGPITGNCTVAASFSQSSSSISRLQGAYNSSTGLVTSLAYPNKVSANSLLLVSVTWGAVSANSPPATPTVTDSLGNSFSLVRSAYDSPMIQGWCLYYAINTKGTGADTIKVSYARGSNYGGMVIEEFSGVSTSSPLDGSAIQHQPNITGGTNAFSSGALSTSSSGDLIYASTCNVNSGVSNSLVPGTNFTSGTIVSSFWGVTGSFAGTEYLIQPSPGSTTATFTTSKTAGEYGITIAAAFKASGASSKTTTGSASPSGTGTVSPSGSTPTVLTQSESITGAGVQNTGSISPSATTGVLSGTNSTSMISPVADAGPDQYVKSGSTVTLNGSNSTDSVGRIVSYKWTQTRGLAVKLSNPSAPKCKFTAPNTASGEVLAFNLTVTDSAGMTSSASCLVNVSATDKGPSAHAGADQSVSPYTIVTLSRSGSSDQDGAIVSYQWVQISGPSVTIYNANTTQASFVAPDSSTLGASLVFNLQVTDTIGLTSRDQCTVSVLNADQPPVANAGANQTVAALSSATLDGSGSYDPVNSTNVYRWKQISGVPVTLSDPTAKITSFTVPNVTGAQSTDLLFMLTVTDVSNHLSSIAKCTVTVMPQ